MSVTPNNLALMKLTDSFQYQNFIYECGGLKDSAPIDKCFKLEFSLKEKKNWRNNGQMGNKVQGATAAIIV